MRNETDSKDEIEKSSSSTSAVLESVDLTERPTTSIEPNKICSKSTDSHATLQRAASERLAIQSHHVIAVEENVHRPTTSGLNFRDEECEVNRLTNSQPNLGGLRADVYVVRTLAGGIINSTNAMHGENYVKKVNSKKSLKRIPPSYSTVLKLGPPISDFGSDTYPSIPFITRQPPPSYAEVHGGWDENPSIVSADSYSLGPNPLYISCPRCRTIVISDIHTERSHLSYIVSVVLCVCLCWPCCLLPFCLKSCRNTYHFCPTCHYYLGVYRPC